MAELWTTDFWNSSTATGSLDRGAGEPPLQSLPMFRIRNYLWSFGAPPVLLLGNFGNVMTIIIMRRMASGESAVNVYFTAMAVIDLIILDIYLLGEWVGVTFSFWVKNESNPSCKIYSWISTGSTTISAWFLVCMTVHRSMSVVWPHRVNLLCTRRKVIMLLGGIATFYAAVYSHNLYGYNLVYIDAISKHYCYMMLGDYFAFIEEVFTYIDLMFYALVPFALLFASNGVLVWKLKMAATEAGHRLTKGQSEQSDARQRTTKSVTLTVILVSIAFIALTLPSAIFYAVAMNVRPVSVYEQALFYLLNAVSNLLMFCNNAVNFYLYCLTGKRFREEFVTAIGAGRVLKSPGVSSVSDDSSKRHTLH